MFAANSSCVQKRLQGVIIAAACWTCCSCLRDSDGEHIEYTSLISKANYSGSGKSQDEDYLATCEAFTSGFSNIVYSSLVARNKSWESFVELGIKRSLDSRILFFVCCNRLVDHPEEGDNIMKLISRLRSTRTNLGFSIPEHWQRKLKEENPKVLQEALSASTLLRGDCRD